MERVTEAWFVDEPTTGDFVKIGYKQGGVEKAGSITGTALHLLESKAGDDASERNVLLLRAIQTFVNRSPSSAIVIIGSPLELD